MRLIIAEKPSVAKEIARYVGADRPERGYLSGKDIVVSWCVGHLIEMAPPEAYDTTLKKWSLDTLPVIPKEYQTIVKEQTASQFEILRGLMQREDLTDVVCATDAGREGELIFRLVYEKAGCHKPVKRLWISSLEEKSIRDGLAALKDGGEYERLYQAALCRQRADWLIGMNFTRFYSVMYNQTLKAGRVQTPTVNLIVKRQQEIDHFTPQTYFVLTADLGSFQAFHRVDTEAAAQEIIKRCGGKDAYVTKAERQEKRENPPALYDLTTLQREANRFFGYPAQQTLDVMQALYEAKLATYPRTDSRYITADQESSTRELIGKLLAGDVYRLEQAVGPKSFNLTAIVNDKKVTDHHALLPTVHVTPDRLTGLPPEQKNILTLVLYRLLAAVSPAYRFTASKVIFDVDGVPFAATGREVLEEGYRGIVNQMEKELQLKKKEEEKPDEPENAVLPLMGEGNIFSVHRVSGEAKKTQPPKPYTEDTLLSAMEHAGKEISDRDLQEAIKECGLGTPATRAGVIENIIRTGYIERQGKKLIPTEKALTFTKIVSERIKSPELTADWEKRLDQIQKGESSPDEFMEGIEEFIRSFIRDFKALSSPDDCKEAFRRPERESIGICPRCGKRVVEYPKSFSCESGKDGCGFVIWKQIASKAITLAMAKKLLSNGKTAVIKGFTSKAGKPFDAMLSFRADYSVGFEFPDRK